MVHVSPSSKGRGAKHQTTLSGRRTRAPAMDRPLVKVSVGSTVHEIKGVRLGRLNAVIKVLKQRALKGDGAEVTFRFVGDDVEILEAPPKKGEMDQPRAAPEVIIERSPDTVAALERARERGRHRVAEILERAEMLNGETFGARLGLTRATVNERRQRHEVLGLDGPKRGWKYPEWQIGEDGKPFEALPALFDRLGDSPWAVYRFLTQHHGELEGRTALEALREGDAPLVLDTAEGVARGTFA